MTLKYFYIKTDDLYHEAEAESRNGVWYPVRYTGRRLTFEQVNRLYHSA